MMACVFNADSTRMVTASKDGSLIVWDVAVRYALNEDTKILRRIPCAVRGGHYTRLALSARGVLAATVEGKGLFFIDVERCASSRSPLGLGDITARLVLGWASPASHRMWGGEPLLEPGIPDVTIRNLFIAGRG